LDGIACLGHVRRYHGVCYHVTTNLCCQMLKRKGHGLSWLHSLVISCFRHNMTFDSSHGECCHVNTNLCCQMLKRKGHGLSWLHSLVISCFRHNMTFDRSHGECYHANTNLCCQMLKRKGHGLYWAIFHVCRRKPGPRRKPTLSERVALSIT
jgi:hypothetical protein